MKIKDWYVSNSKMTGWVRTNEKKMIIETPPVWRKFIGQPFGNLKEWLRNMDPNGFRIKRMKRRK